ncbi:TPA: AAA family ATPase [Pseudomonas aeruginosa]|uniref:AAA family ATPase n=1 Tax=Pseudomonas aeruginosa TaxID=287 RepID=UPI001A1B364D|nr:AAA family ATPase [Pseudomonas aeruginosa]MBI8706803.1 AAA family ATPase [Pseudomonas aeruginosa]MCW5380603.1 AAA family ATPase [Pseudomonas aeruginosa]HEK1437320.1 AAA family ATPase [Pseudomonas aeruginosa]HEK1438810.1 AAA family ATPase [Pseudomonas aeruginosa]
MKIKIENFGPVKEFIFDTEKDFHIIIGDNNVGKSYVLTAYYFIVKSLIEISSSRGMNKAWVYFSQIYEEEPSFLETTEAKNFIKQANEKKTGDISITDLYKFIAKDFLQNSLAVELSKKIKSSYNEIGSIVNSFSKSSFAKFTIQSNMLSIILEGNVDEFKIVEVDLQRSVLVRISKQNRSPTISNGKQVIYKHTNEDIEATISKIKQHCLVRLMALLEEAIGPVRDIDYLPASRSGLYQALSAFGQIIAELSKSRSFLSSRIELPGISGQLSDYFIKLTNIRSTKSLGNDAFTDAAKKIENSVLKGSIEYDFKEKRLYYRPQGTNLRLDLSATSSMVSETAPIVAYIRHIIAWNDTSPNLIRFKKRTKNIDNTPQKKILIIEEPEAHLHPSNQIKMTDIYADLSTAGVKIIMTSHSNYIFNKVSNLVIEGKLQPSKTQCDLFKVTNEGSIGESQEIDEYGINDNNFSDASEELINERMDLINNRESSSD